MSTVAAVRVSAYVSVAQPTTKFISAAVIFAITLWLIGCGAAVGSGNRTGSGGSGSGGSTGGGSTPSAFLYGANFSASSISGYKVDIDGSLSALSGFPLTTAQNPQSLAIASNYLLVGNGFSPGANNGQIALYSVDATTGMLTESSSFVTSPSYVALTPKATFAYDSETGIAGYSTAGGKLTPLPTSPYIYSGSANGNAVPLTPDRLLIDSSGKFLYASFYPATFNTPYGYFGVVPINADGSLGAFPSGSPAPSCNIAGGLAADAGPSGNTFLYESCGDPNSDATFRILIFTVDQSGNILSDSSFTGAAKPGGLASGLAVDKSGKWLIGLDVNHDLMYVLAIDPTSGSLTEMNTVAAGHRPNSVTFDDSGRFLYASNGDYPTGRSGGSNNISAYAFDPSTGNAMPLAASPFPAGTGITSLAITH